MRKPWRHVFRTPEILKSACHSPQHHLNSRILLNIKNIIMQNIVATAMQRNWPVKALSNHGISGTFDVRVVGAPETPLFQLYFRSPRIRSSRGLILLPIPNRHSQHNGRCKSKEAFNMTDLAIRGVPRPCHECRPS